MITDKEYSLSKEEKLEWLDDFSNTQKWLGLLLAYYPEPRSDAFKVFHEQVVQLSKKTQPDLWLTEQLRNQVIELTSRDPRLNIRE